ncbi:unnamed protein product [Trypanosoma congolense IL3000]|uniref:WGS project CAEQ00000000 data, annotated contig 907 n=1 Tax=Trypanosoma congolense (strain IL3000) TaxID=1068625 RepID=F9WJG3_TRYCI|nr:unnamed protein product [Trypanosoma congolense IL3000]
MPSLVTLSSFRYFKRNMCQVICYTFAATNFAYPFCIMFLTNFQWSQLGVCHIPIHVHNDFQCSGDVLTLPTCYRRCGSISPHKNFFCVISRPCFRKSMLFNEMLCHIFELMSSVWAFGTDFSGGVSGFCSMFSLYFCSSVSVSVTVHRLRHPARTYTLYFLNIFIYRESDIFIQLLMCGSSFFFFGQTYFVLWSCLTGLKIYRSFTVHIYLRFSKELYVTFALLLVYVARENCYFLNLNGQFHLPQDTVLNSSL